MQMRVRESTRDQRHFMAACPDACDKNDYLIVDAYNISSSEQFHQLSYDCFNGMKVFSTILLNIWLFAVGLTN